MTTINSITRINNSIKNHSIEDLIKLDRSKLEVLSIDNLNKYPESFNTLENKNLRTYIESFNTLENKNIRSLFNDNNYRFLESEIRIPKNLYIFLEYSFLSVFFLISKPFLEITPGKIGLILFWFRLNRKIVYSKDSAYQPIKEFELNKFKTISIILRKLFKKTLELEIIGLHYPFYETNIFVNLLSKTINKIKINRILSKFFYKANIIDPNKITDKKIYNIPSFISGIKIKIAGRLLTQRIVPRKTVKIISKGSLARDKVIFLEKGRITNKNKRGAFNVTMTIGHIKNKNI
jgi:Mitochondrial ribosomal protein (VAR1)